MTTQTDCVTHFTNQNNANKSTLTKWIDSLDGRSRVAKILGVNKSTLYRWEMGELPVPNWLVKYMSMSEELAELRQENARLKRGMR
jgi:outer membrane biogenesis lipoprotein LolB